MPIDWSDMGGAERAQMIEQERSQALSERTSLRDLPCPKAVCPGCGKEKQLTRQLDGYGWKRGALAWPDHAGNHWGRPCSMTRVAYEETDRI